MVSGFKVAAATVNTIYLDKEALKLQVAQHGCYLIRFSTKKEKNTRPTIKSTVVGK